MSTKFLIILENAHKEVLISCIFIYKHVGYQMKKAAGNFKINKRLLQHIAKLWNSLLYSVDV